MQPDEKSKAIASRPNLNEVPLHLDADRLPKRINLVASSLMWAMKKNGDFDSVPTPEDVCCALLELVRDIDANQPVAVLNLLGLRRSDNVGDCIKELIEAELIQVTDKGYASHFSGLFDTSTDTRSWRIHSI